MIAFLSALSAIPKVLCAADVKAALVMGCPAPGARLERTKRVKCFLAAVAMSITPPGMGRAAIRIAGFTRAHFAGIVHSSLLYLKQIF